MEACSRCGRLHAAWLANEQLCAEFGFQIGEVVAECGAGDAQMLDRVRLRPVFMDGAKIAKLSAIHGF
jgi:predicted Rdx family selenoprotein